MSEIYVTFKCQYFQVYVMVPSNFLWDLFPNKLGTHMESISQNVFYNCKANIGKNVVQ